MKKKKQIAKLANEKAKLEQKEESKIREYLYLNSKLYLIQCIIISLINDFNISK